MTNPFLWLRNKKMSTNSSVDITKELVGYT